MTDQPGLFDAQLELAAQILATGRAEGLARMDTARAHARRVDPATSHQAAESISVRKLADSRQAVLDLLGRIGPATDTRIAAEYELRRESYVWPVQSPSGLRSRRAELALAGLVTDTGRREQLPSGRASIVWAVR